MILPNLDENESEELKRLLKKLIGCDIDQEHSIQVADAGFCARVVVIPAPRPDVDAKDEEIRIIDVPN